MTARDERVTGAIDGRVIYKGPLPEETTIYVGELNRRIDAHTIHVDPDTRGLRDAVVSLEGRFDVPPTQPRRGQPTSEQPTIDQRDAIFVPHVLAVRAGRPVRFTSFDAGNHNIRAVSFNKANTFNKYFAEGAVYEHTFKATPDLPPVKLICDLHHWMLAWVYVFDHPHFAVTAKDGRFRIEGVPPGRYTLVVHHADGRLRHRRSIQVEPGRDEHVTVKLERGPATRKAPLE